MEFLWISEAGETESCCYAFSCYVSYVIPQNNSEVMTGDDRC